MFPLAVYTIHGVYFHVLTIITWTSIECDELLHKFLTGESEEFVDWSMSKFFYECAPRFRSPKNLKELKKKKIYFFSIFFSSAEFLLEYTQSWPTFFHYLYSRPNVFLPTGG